jgi:Tol biopolymer transport system component
MENQVRELLREIAEDIVPQAKVPPTLRPRARRRIATTVGATLVVVVALIIGSIVAVQSIRTSAPPRPANPGPTPEQLGRFARVHGWIAYGDGSQIVAVDPTHPANRIAFGPANGAAPIGWSRDGTRLLLEEMRDAGPQGIRSDLLVLRADGSRTQLTSNGRSSGGSFSPDGAMVVYESDLSLYVVDADGGTPRLLAAADSEHARWLGSPAWTPDGSRIAFAVYDENRSTTSIGVINPDGTGRRKLIDLGEGRSTGGLAWSPDGSRLAFHSVLGPEQLQIYAVDADGSGLRQLTRSGRSASDMITRGGASPTWSPDGSRIAFVRPGGLYTVALDGSDVRKVEGVLTDQAIAWNPIS